MSHGRHRQRRRGRTADPHANDAAPTAQGFGALIRARMQAAHIKSKAHPGAVYVDKNGHTKHNPVTKGQHGQTEWAKNFWKQRDRDGGR